MRHTSILLILLFFILVISSYGQVPSRKNYFPVWTFHQDSINIHGISVGLWSYNSKPRQTNTNGIKFELVGVGIGIPLIPSSPLVETDSAFVELVQEPLSERINGLNLSTSGTVCHCLTNGLAAGFIGQINLQVNGMSSSLLVNYSQKHNGVMIALTSNQAYYINGLQVGLTNYGYKTKGLQIGLLNETKKLKGLQFGLWNVNQKRRLPLVNWNFKRDAG